MKLVLNRIALHTGLGIRSWERVVKRIVLINITLHSDKLLDYRVILERLVLSVADVHFEYVEDLAETLATALINCFAPVKLSLEVKKPSFFKLLESASVQVEYDSETDS
ncbi:dihydroneopterin aldolase [Neorickettsia sennetsu]|uniref:Dihydroneopterin aldolase n=1 Tax=Ehrlichia sennetsu (strain ATCC VR-367 / Miyayama) TaxID=222891 RepID=Q2GDR1_EHRS3|nr:dihydroneopterin aldolase [Neorickettsia sennetsu]ABD46107.1 putative dihydroneopterin aldolase [Neorickettsia sennetsu str. Miyayama]